MTRDELKSMTILQLRKIAKENNIVLGAGVDKAMIVEKIASVLSDVGTDTETVEAVPEAADLSAISAESDSSAPVAEQPVPASPRFSGRPAYQVAPAYSSTRTYWQGNSVSSRPVTPDPQRVQPTRPGTGLPRFGPAPRNAAAAPAAPHISNVNPFAQDPSFSPAQPATPVQSASPVPPAVPVRPAVSPLPDHRIGFAGSSGFGPQAQAGFSSSSYSAPASRVTDPFAAVPQQDPGLFATPTLEELLASGDYEEGSGVLELHPNGYGFLRSANFTPSSRDIYVSMAQIRRFGLRTGDLITGKVRPQHEGDKYAAMLYIDTVNGIHEEEAFTRPSFDDLTPVYPSRRMSLEYTEGNSLLSMRLVDLIAPLGFGQRGLLLCPPDTGKRALLADYARVITKNYPEVEVLVLLIDTTPEDATMFRESVPCPVLASTFDQAPEAHLRLSEMVMERAMRLVEQKKDVVLLVDSLTRLAKIYTTAAVQQGRSVPGMVNPASLFRAKRLFGSARACKEGGSLTVIAAMDIQTGSKVDDSVVEEFKGTANMELTMDRSVARAQIEPALNLQMSFTKNADILLDDRQKEGLSLIRQMLGSTSSVVAIPQLSSMMEKTANNQELLLKMKDWFALMNR